MPEYKIGDRVIHGVYGEGEVVAIEDKGTPEQPFWYYFIETGELTLWVPIQEAGGSSLHPAVAHAEYLSLSDLLVSKAEKPADRRQ